MLALFRSVQGAPQNFVHMVLLLETASSSSYSQQCVIISSPRDVMMLSAFSSFSYARKSTEINFPWPGVTKGCICARVIYECAHMRVDAQVNAYIARVMWRPWVHVR